MTTKPLKEDWEIEFDKNYVCQDRFVDVVGTINNGKACFFIPQSIKAFIRETISQTKSQIVEQILGMKCMKDEPIDIHIFDGHNDIIMCRNQLREEIKEEILKIK